MKNIVLIITLCLCCPISMMAQDDKENIINKVRYAGEKLRYGAEEMLRLDNGHDDSGDLIRIKGYYYMPLYSLNLYNGEETKAFQEECMKLFTAKYPLTEVMSVSLPQLQWIHESVKKRKKVVGYLETMYCYIIAKDGADGYINARFSFRRYKDVGDSYGPLMENWPKWERVDFLTPELYHKLLTK